MSVDFLDAAIKFRHIIQTVEQIDFFIVRLTAFNIVMAPVTRALYDVIFNVLPTHETTTL